MDPINKIFDSIPEFSLDRNIVPKKKIFHNLVLSGGSVKGVSQLGAIKKLVEEGVIEFSKLKKIIGVSVGSMTGSLIALGFTIDEIWKFIYDLNIKKLVNPDLLLFLEKCGVEEGKIFYNMFNQILEKKTGIKDITFKQLFDISKKHLIIIGCCLTTKESVCYDHINTPDFKVALAIRISGSMPGFFTPVDIDGKKYIDGAVLNNYPMNVVKNEIDDTVGILICKDYNTNYTYPEEYLFALINLFTYRFYREDCPKYRKNTVYIREVDKQSSFNFDVSNEAKQIMFDIGYKSAEEFLKNMS
jgi:NTE family protein